MSKIPVIGDRRPVFVCPSCGEDRPAAMTHRGCCYRCAAKADGRPVIEQHHVLGRAVSDIVVPLCGNWHRVLHARQKSRDDTLKNPGKDPLHRIASVVVTLAEALRLFADYGQRRGWQQELIDFAATLARIGEKAADWLLILAGELEERFGPDWPRIFNMPEWHP